MAPHIVPFERVFPGPGPPFMRVGDGDLGGKALGLMEAYAALAASAEANAETSAETSAITGAETEQAVRLGVPATVILATGVFESFMRRNRLYETALSGASDERIAHAFVAGDFPVEHAGDLVALAEQTRGRPLAVRSSSLLEDSLDHPFAGVYETKMVPNNQSDADTRIRSLLEAVKFVYASTFFKSALDYDHAIGANPRDERMAVLIQEVVGRGHGTRFYPDVSGVCRSYNYYRIGAARPDEGVVSLALGLGKTVVDGLACWTYSPAHPKVRMPFMSMRDMLYSTQLRFWAVHTGSPPAYDPVRDTEYLVEPEIAEAEFDGTLSFVASTFDMEQGTLIPGVRRTGAPVIDFGPLLQQNRIPLNASLVSLLERFERHTGGAVEIEFAATLPGPNETTTRLVVLQVRAMHGVTRSVQLADRKEGDWGRLVESAHVMGNGRIDGLVDIVYMKPGTFDGSRSQQIAEEIEFHNRRLRDEGKRYVLLGFGRWGSSDPWGGIPVTWGQIGAAAVIVESSLPGMQASPSQGSHFFHNLESFQICYFSVFSETENPIDWDWLSEQRVMGETEHIRHVQTPQALAITVDGRVGHGEILFVQPLAEQRNDDQ